MSYYRIDPIVTGREPGPGDAASRCSTLFNALQVLRNVRIDSCAQPAVWVSELGAATERAVALFERHIEAAAAQRSTLRAIACRNTRALAELMAEHGRIRASLQMQRELASRESSRCPSGAVRLLDVAVDTECLLAIHINGLATLLRQSAERTTNAPGTNAERAGPQRIGVKV